MTPELLLEDLRIDLNGMRMVLAGRIRTAQNVYEAAKKYDDFMASVQELTVQKGIINSLSRELEILDEILQKYWPEGRKP